MNIERIGGNFFSDSIQKKSGEANGAKKKPDTRQDKLDLSPEAQKLKGKTDILGIAKAELEKIPEVRQAKLEEVKGKIASRYYDQQEVIGDIAEAMGNSEDLVLAMKDQNQQAGESIPMDDLKRLAVVFSRMEKGHYNSMDIMDKVAEGILKELKQNSP